MGMQCVLSEVAVKLEKFGGFAGANLAEMNVSSDLSTVLVLDRRFGGALQ